MKFLSVIAFCMLFFRCLQAGAQIQKDVPVSQYNYNKPKLFKELPDRISFRINNLDTIFNKEIGKRITLSLSPDFLWQGTIVSKAEDAQANVKSIVIKSFNKAGASLALSRIINENNTITYRGRIMSFKHGDAYDLVSENGAYFLIKKNVYDLYEE